MGETITLGTAVGVLVLLQIKHMFADFYLQTPMMLAGRGQYVHAGRGLHCLVHVIGSLLCLVLIGLPVSVLVALIVAEWVLHYHIDWAKGRWSDKTGHGPADAGYWRAFGLDQTLHQLTYVAMLWAMVAMT